MPKPFATHRAQIESILLGWGMQAAHAVRTADVMAWADLRGVDSHGLSMLTVYNDRRVAGIFCPHDRGELFHWTRAPAR